MKKLSAYLILTILLLNSAGFFIYYAMQLQTIRRDARAAMRTLPEDALTVIKVSHAEFHQSLVEDDEIKYRGKMFDIARAEIREDEVVLWGLYDEKEDDLMTFLNHIVSQPEYDKTTLPSIVIQYICLEYVNTVAEFGFSSVFRGQLNPLTLYNKRYQSISSNPQVLPPESVS